MTKIAISVKEKGINNSEHKFWSEIMKQKTSEEIKRLSKGCYCENGEGTFKVIKGKETCLYCVYNELINTLKKQHNEEIKKLESLNYEYQGRIDVLRGEIKNLKSKSKPEKAGEE